MGPPDRNGERKDKIVVLAAARVERQVTGGGKLNPEILQLADQCLGFGEFALDPQPPLKRTFRAPLGPPPLLSTRANSPLCARYLRALDEEFASLTYVLSS